MDLFNDAPVTLMFTATQAGANIPSVAFSNSTQGVTPSIPEPSTWVMMAPRLRRPRLRRVPPAHGRAFGIRLRASVDRSRKGRLPGGLRSYPALTILWREAERTVSPHRRTDRSRRCSPTLDSAERRSSRRRLLVRCALNTKVGRPAAHARSRQNIFCTAEKLAWGKRSGCRSVCRLMAREACRINHFAPPRLHFDFSLHLLGAAQRKRLDRLLLCCYPHSCVRPI